jgi:hypothetical protein
MNDEKMKGKKWKHKEENITRHEKERHSHCSIVVLRWRRAKSDSCCWSSVYHIQTVDLIKPICCFLWSRNTLISIFVKLRNAKIIIMYWNLSISLKFLCKLNEWLRIPARFSTLPYDAIPTNSVAQFLSRSGYFELSKNALFYGP